MSDFWEAVLLGAVQGATEFLPVSSSGHLLAAKTIFGYQAELAFDVALHLPTLLAVLIYFRKDLLRLLTSPELRPVLTRLVVGTIPAAAIAYAFRGWRKGLPPSVVIIGWTLSGTYLLLSAGRQGVWPHHKLPLARAFLVGGAQGIAAILPGFSRSGSSLASGLWLGLERGEAYRFSFLLAIPITLGAILEEGRHLLEPGRSLPPGGWPAVIAAMVTAFVVGIACIHILYRVVIRNRFHRFGWYNLAAAAAFAIYLLSV